MSISTNIVPWVDKYRPHKLEHIVHQEKLMMTLKNAVKSKELPHLLFYGPPGTGKCLAPETEVLLYKGGIKQAKDIQAGDVLMDENCRKTTVRKITNGYDMMYGIYENGKLVFKCNSEHILTLKLMQPYMCENYMNDYVIFYWFEDHLLHSAIYYKDNITFHLPANANKMGDVCDIRIKDYIKQPQKWKESYCSYRVCNLTMNNYNDIFADFAYEYGAMIAETNKCIVRRYKFGSKIVRQKVLDGIKNTIGKTIKNKIQIHCYNEQQYNDIIFVARSLGYHVFEENNIITIHQRKEKEYFQAYNFDVKELGYGKYCGFTLNGSHRFLLGDLTVTHNTTTILALANELFGHQIYKDRVLELNASDERGINIVRTEIITFAKRIIGNGDPNYPSPPYKIIILDEADAMTSDAQAALRKIMEETSAITRFCIICNYVDKIIEPLASRCMKFKFSPIASIVMKERLQRIAHNEHLNIENDIFDTIIDIVDGDLRKGIMLLQNVKYINLPEHPVSIDDVYDLDGFVPHKIIDKLIIQCEHKGIDIIALSKDFYSKGYSIKKLCEQLSPIIATHNYVKDKCKSDILIKIAKICERLNDGSSEYIQLVNLLMFMQHILSTYHE